MKKINTKFSKQRNKIATALKIWRKTKSALEISKEMGISKNQVSKILSQSKIYTKIRPLQYKKNYKKAEIKIKHSEYRNTIAICLKTWKNTKSITRTAEKLKITMSQVCRFISTSKMYKRYMSFKKSLYYLPRERQYINIWARKIALIHKLGGKCSKCGNKNILILEFHHINNSNKNDDLSSLIRKKRSWNIINKEISKCILLCRNCHQELHNPNQKNKKLKQDLLKLIGINKCSICGYKENIACLDFHHKNPNKKLFQITFIRKISKNPTILRKHMAELKKCNVLCANCHMIKHINSTQFNRLKHSIYKRVIAAQNKIDLLWNRQHGQHH